MRPACTCLAPVVLRPAGPCSLDIYRKFTSGNLRPEGAEGLSPEPISAKIIVRRFDGRMAFVPEGQADRNQARSAWVAMQRGPVPEGRSKSWSVSHTETFL